MKKRYLYIYTDSREATREGDMKETSRVIKNHDKSNPNKYEYVHVYDNITGKFIRTEVANNYIHTIRTWQKVANRSNDSFKENFNL